MAKSSAATSAIEALVPFGTCEVSDSLIQMGHPHGGYIPDLEPFSPKVPTRIIGQAFTVKMVSQADKDAPKPDQHFVDAAEEDSIMIVSAPSGCKNAIWGGLMTARAQARKVKGVILDGRCRDLAEHREAGFAVSHRSDAAQARRAASLDYIDEFEIVQVYARGHSMLAGEAHHSFPAVTVSPGDIIVADEDGVVVIPLQDAAEVARRCAHNKVVDEKCMADLRAGRSVADTFKEHRGK